MESVCHGYMCILLYVKLLQCSGFPEIYAWLEEGALGHSAMGICAFLYMSNFCSVVVFQRSMLDWRRGKGSVCHGYMCILLYVRLIWCSGFPEIYAWLEEGGMGSVCHGYMCILLYVKLNWCSSFPEIYGWLEEEAWSQSAMGICAFFSMWNLFGVVVFQRSMLDWRRGHGVSLPQVYVYSSLCETYSV